MILRGRIYEIEEKQCKVSKELRFFAFVVCAGGREKNENLALIARMNPRKPENAHKKFSIIILLHLM